MGEGGGGVQGAGEGDAREEAHPDLALCEIFVFGWFEPLRDGIEKEQRAQRERMHKAAYARHIGLFPAVKMSVIVMDKMVGMLMMGREKG